MSGNQIPSRQLPRLYSALALIGIGLVLAVHVGAQQGGAPRKVVERIAAPYPPLARSMALQGTVRVEAVVAPDGSAKSVDIKGGHPVLAQAAANTVRHWKWEPAAHETHETVEVKFSPE